MPSKYLDIAKHKLETKNLITNAFRLLLVPAIFLGSLSVFYFFWNRMALPDEEQLVPIITSYFDQYGSLLIVISAGIEGLFVVGWYFPGTTIIVTCLVATVTSTEKFVGVAIAAAAGLLVAHIINFILGKYGWYRILLRYGFQPSIERAKVRLSKYGFAAIILTYWQFSFASATSTAAGVLDYSFPRFVLLSAVAVLFWTAMWAAFIYIVGAAAMTYVSVRFLIAGVIVWITVVALVSAIRRRRG